MAPPSTREEKPSWVLEEMKDKLSDMVGGLGDKNEEAQHAASDAAGRAESAAGDAVGSAQDAAGSARDGLGR
jgi:hypothetical protein